MEALISDIEDILPTIDLTIEILEETLRIYDLIHFKMLNDLEPDINKIELSFDSCDSVISNFEL